MIPVNDPPFVDQVSARETFTENAGPLLFTSSARVTDPDSIDFGGGQLTVAISQNADSEDLLRITNSGTRNGDVSVAGDVVRLTTDVYYQTLRRVLIPNGRPIIGAYNFSLNQRVSVA